MASQNKLYVYKASAGSGKTFTLAVEYIKLLIKDPFAYRHILAVTFTNKATAEMKMRILGQLNGIAHGYQKSEGYFVKVREDASVQALKLSDAEIRRRAGSALANLLHDYHHFRVVTIDSFFQSIVRELAYELDLTANLRIDLKAKEALEEAVKSLVDELGDEYRGEEQKRLLQMIYEFVSERIANEKSWNVVDSIKSFGMHIFDEKYLKLGNKDRHALGDATKLATLKRRIWQRLRDKKRETDDAVMALKALLNTQGLDETNLKGKTRSGVAALMARILKMDERSDVQKVLGTSWHKLLDNEAEWSTDPTRHAWLRQNALPCLHDIIKMLFDRVTCRVVLENINEMMLINLINTRLRELNNEANRFLLADTGHFLQSLIDNSDVPFIYERTGVRYRHIMIDEFQDTSEIQWDNFRPLLANSLAQDYECLLVGDVKQSIYRWRNSDWSIFNGIERGEFSQYVNPIPLKVNFRSAERVVKFNNEVCSAAVDVVQQYYKNNFKRESQDITLAYADVKQEVNPKKVGQGFVRVDQVVARPDEAGAECTLRHVERTLREVLKAGVPAGKIAILVRKSDYGEQIVRHFETAMPEVKVVSNEAYLLGASSAVRLLVRALSLLENPNDKLLLHQLVVDYQRDVLGACKDTMWPERVFMENAADIEQLLPEAFGADKREALIKMPLYELCENLYEIFQLRLIKGQDAYLYSFYSNLLKFLQDKVATRSMFLKHWEETMQNEMVQMGNLDGLRIMTIHKSKGLEFHTVIAPFFEWRADGLNPKMKNFVWCAPKQEPFNEIPLLPIQYKSLLNYTQFGDDYENEMLKQLVDNLNLMYVTFTRAEQNLVVISRGNPPRQSSSSEGTMTMQRILQSALEQVGQTDLGISEVEVDVEGEKFKRYEYGSMDYVEPESDAAIDENILTRPPRPLELPFFHLPMTATFLQSNESRQFLEPLNEETSADGAEYLLMGNIVHGILEQIETTDDLPAALRMAEGEGLFETESQREQVSQMLTQALKHPKAAEWFGKQWRVMNENRIFYKTQHGDVKFGRPDRVIFDGERTVVIDYKTSHNAPTPSLQQKYCEQVQKYMAWLSEMGYPNVEGYVWYITQNHTEEVPAM